MCSHIFLVLFRHQGAYKPLHLKPYTLSQSFPGYLFCNCVSLQDACNTGSFAPQGVCADQAKVCGYHRFQQVVLNEAVVEELKHLFKTKAELLHQTIALHSYTAVLSRLQVESYLYNLLSSNPITRSVAVHKSGPGKAILKCIVSWFRNCLSKMAFLIVKYATWLF